MKFSKKFYTAAIFCGAALLTNSAFAQAKTRAPELKLIGSIALPGVEGRIDHMAFDPQTRRLFVSALENHSLEIVDLKSRRRTKSIAGLNEPQGAVFVPKFNRVLVCSRGDGTLRSFDARTWREGAWAGLGRNADNVRLDLSGNTIYAGSNGEPGAGALDAINLRAMLPQSQGGKPPKPSSPADFRLNTPRRVNARASVALSSHPESFQLDPKRNRAFVNVPDEHVVAVIDTQKMQIAARWPVPFKRNFAMAFSASRNRVFIATRNPPRLLAYRADNGKLVGQQPCAGDADEIFYNGQNGRLYIVGGDGTANAFDARSDALPRLQTTTTAPRARMGFFMPTSHLLAVAAPRTPGHRARILLYQTR